MKKYTNNNNNNNIKALTAVESVCTDFSINKSFMMYVSKGYRNLYV